MCPRTGSRFDWLTGVRPGLTAEHLSKFMLSFPERDATASVTTVDTLFSQHLVSGDTVLQNSVTELLQLLI